MENNFQDFRTDLALDQKNLYREESFTDMKRGTVRMLMPVHPDGRTDESRMPLFVASTTLMSPKGPLPIQCPVQAKTLSEAVEKFPDALATAVENMFEQAKRAQREESSRIIIPGA